MHKCGLSICDSFDLFKSEFYILIQGLVISIIFGFANEEVLNVKEQKFLFRNILDIAKVD